jgi:hypothetical protein
MNRFFVIAVVGMLGLGAPAQEKRLPYLKGVIAAAQVDRSHESVLYTYSYKVTNSATSDGAIQLLSIDISRDSTFVPDDTTGLRFAKGWMERSFRRIFPILGHRIVPVGFPSVPRFWDGLIGSDRTADLLGDGRNDIEPGHTLNGFTLTSKGIPGIRKFVARPYYDPNDYYPSVDDVSEEEAQRIVAQVDSDRVRIAFSGYTIGPTAPPADFVPAVWLDTLISYKHQAFSFGWITNQGIANSLDQKLDNARKQLERGNNRAAKNILEAFINEVEAQKEKHLSSEAHALLKFNAEYLISKLE